MPLRRHLDTTFSRLDAFFETLVPKQLRHLLKGLSKRAYEGELTLAVDHRGGGDRQNTISLGRRHKPALLARGPVDGQAFSESSLAGERGDLSGPPAIVVEPDHPKSYA